MATPRPAAPTREALNRLLISVVIAAGLWGWVTLSRDPETTKRFQEVPVQVANLASDLIVVGDVAAVETRYTGTRSNTDELTFTDAQAVIDLSGIDGPGSYTVEVEATEPPDIWSARADPSRMTIQVERRMSGVFPLNPIVSGTLNLNQQIGAITPSASEVVVSGPESSVSQVRVVNLPVDTAGRTSNFVGVFTPIAVDSGGQQIAGVELNPVSISAEVQITARGKELAVVTQTVGSPASGFEIIDRAINPITALVDGPAETLDSLITVSTLPVDVSGARTDVTQRVRLADLPPGVTIVEPSSGSVDVVIQIRARGVQQSLPEQPVVVLNVAPGLVAEVTPGTVVVDVEASEQQLVDLAPGSLQVIVDAAGRGAGTYTLQPSVVVPATLEWLSVVPNSVTVVIRPSTPGEGSATPPVPSPTIATPTAETGR